jgi:uncharacterized protein DUF5675
MKFFLLRSGYIEDKPTFATLVDQGSDFNIQTLELPWRDNQPEISCSPPGLYRCYRSFYNRKGYEVFEYDVEGRTDMKIHKGNWMKDTLGCTLTGEVRDVSKDAVWRSGDAFNMLMLHTKDVNEFELEIIV